MYLYSTLHIMHSPLSQPDDAQHKPGANRSHGYVSIKNFPVKLKAEIYNVACHNDMPFGDMAIRILSAGIKNYPLQQRTNFVDKGPDLNRTYLRRTIRQELIRKGQYPCPITEEMMEAKRVEILALRQSRFEKMNLSGRKEL